MSKEYKLGFVRITETHLFDNEDLVMVPGIEEEIVIGFYTLDHRMKVGDAEVFIVDDSMSITWRESPYPKEMPEGWITIELPWATWKYMELYKPILDMLEHLDPDKVPSADDVCDRLELLDITNLVELNKELASSS